MKHFLKSFIKGNSIRELLLTAYSAEKRNSVSIAYENSAAENRNILIVELKNHAIILNGNKDVLNQFRIDSTDQMATKLSYVISNTHPNCVALIDHVNIEPTDEYLLMKEAVENGEEFYEEIATANEYYYNKNLSLTKSKIIKLKEQAGKLANKFPKIMVLPLLFNSADQMLYLITESNIL